MNDATSNSSEIIFVNFWRGISSWNKSPFTSLKMRKNARSIWQFSFWKRIWNNFVQFSLCWRHFVSVIILNYPPEITFALNNEKQRQKWCIQAKFVARVCVCEVERAFYFAWRSSMSMHCTKCFKEMYIARCTESIKWTMSKDFRHSEPNIEHGPSQPTPTDARVYMCSWALAFGVVNNNVWTNIDVDAVL